MRACACACACALTSNCVSTCPICAEPLVRSGRHRRAGCRARATRAERMGRVVQARLPAQEPRCRTYVPPQCSARHSSANSAIGATHCNSRSASSTIAVVGAISNGSNAPTCSSQRRAIGGGASAASECPSGPRHAKRVGPPSLPTAWPLRPQGRECAGDCQCPPPAASIRHKPTGRRVPQHTGTQGGLFNFEVASTGMCPPLSSLRQRCCCLRGRS